MAKQNSAALIAPQSGEPVPPDKKTRLTEAGFFVYGGP